eukprot:8333-Heterococcus_DN1.PRE.3
MDESVRTIIQGGQQALLTSQTLYVATWTCMLQCHACARVQDATVHCAISTCSAREQALTADLLRVTHRTALFDQLDDLEYPGAEAFYLYSLAEQIVKRTEPDQFDTNEYEQCRFCSTVIACASLCSSSTA